MDHPLSKYSEDQEFLAGLPFTRFRKLNSQELNDLKGKSNKAICQIILFSVSNPIILAPML